jgi:hypothetical protein
MPYMFAGMDKPSVRITGVAGLLSLRCTALNIVLTLLSLDLRRVMDIHARVWLYSGVLCTRQCCQRAAIKGQPTT